MNGTTEESSRLYTPFWAVWVFFLTMLIVHGAQVVNLFRQKSQIKTSFQEAAKVLNSAQTVNSTWVAVSRDVVDMSNASPGARKIVQEFRLRVNSGGVESAPRYSEPVAEPQNSVPAGKPPEPASGIKKK